MSKGSTLLPETNTPLSSRKTFVLAQSIELTAEDGDQDHGRAEDRERQHCSLVVQNSGQDRSQHAWITTEARINNADKHHKIAGVEWITI